MADAGKVDAILLGGDITDFDSPDVAEDLVHLAQDQCDTVLAVAGNCDSPEIDDRLVEIGVSLFGCGAVRDGFGFYGVSAMPPWAGNMYELTEDEIAAALDRGYATARAASKQIMLAHPPPRDTTLDRVHNGQHVGSLSVRVAIETQHPTLVVCGHIHESRGVERMGPTTIVNCGAAFRGEYAVAHVDLEVDVQLPTARLRGE